ncbi:hypothetical protein F8388_011566 [Cannabis sativa]|uniref:Uncharacterized protein n=1 Tax=Cannabis sativa TaxID=3483 RepID=A0A7J6GXL1_CANSA|nr:hypothetical protein F8388_011566 [Cannabis sativa]
MNSQRNFVQKIGKGWKDISTSINKQQLKGAYFFSGETTFIFGLGSSSIESSHCKQEEDTSTIASHQAGLSTIILMTTGWLIKISITRLNMSGCSWLTFFVAKSEATPSATCNASGSGSVTSARVGIELQFSDSFVSKSSTSLILTGPLRLLLKTTCLLLDWPTSKPPVHAFRPLYTLRVHSLNPPPLPNAPDLSRRCSILLPTPQTKDPLTPKPLSNTPKPISQPHSEYSYPKASYIHHRPKPPSQPHPNTSSNPPLTNYSSSQTSPIDKLSLSKSGQLRSNISHQAFHHRSPKTSPYTPKPQHNKQLS